jgi:hypothetical protein
VGYFELVQGVLVTPPVPLKRILLCSARAKHLGHLPKGFVEFHVLIYAFDCPAFGHSATIRTAPRVVTLTATNDVFLNLCGASRYVKQPC